MHRWPRFRNISPVYKAMAPVSRHSSYKVLRSILCSVRAGPMSLRAAVKWKLEGGSGTFEQIKDKFGVSSTTTLFRAYQAALKGEKPKKLGGQCVFSAEQEEVFVKHFMLCAEACWPLSVSEIQDYVQAFCKNENYPCPRWEANEKRPGKDWVTGFLRRHPELKNRRVTAMSNAKAYGLSMEGLQDFFELMRDVLDPDGEHYCWPKDILNYDETALVNDMGPREWKVTKRSDVSPRDVRDTQKGGTSCMFTVSGSGDVLPPYVCSKKQEIKEEGQKKYPAAVFGHSKTGWFTMAVFDDWFEKVVVPWALDPERGQNRLVIGDNLTSHFSHKTMKRAGEVGVFFRLLPPNCTHFLQPLDVSVFHHVKTIWRTFAAEHRATTGKANLAKMDIPVVLRKTVESIQPSAIINGFRATGLVPYDYEQAYRNAPVKLRAGDKDGSVLAKFLASTRRGREEDANARRKGRPAPGTNLTIYPPALDHTSLHSAPDAAPAVDANNNKPGSALFSILPPVAPTLPSVILETDDRDETAPESPNFAPTADDSQDSIEDARGNGEPPRKVVVVVMKKKSGPGRPRKVYTTQKEQRQQAKRLEANARKRKLKEEQAAAAACANSQ